MRLSKLKKRLRDWKLPASIVLLVVILGSFSGCVRHIIIKDSDLIYKGAAGEQPSPPGWDWVLLSQSKFRELTD